MRSINIDFYNTLIMACIAVFCGARENVERHFINVSEKFGTILAKKWHTLIYGGGTFWLMGWVYRWVKQVGWKVVGIIPHFLMSKERWEDHKSNGSELILVETMDERKKILFNRSDTVIMLPWWVGTLDEFFEILSLVQLERRSHTLWILNTDGFYDDLLSLLRNMTERWFIPIKTLQYLVIESDPEKLLDRLSI